MKARSLPRPGTLLVYALLIGFMLFYLLPIYLMFITGLKSFAEVNLRTMWNLPAGIQFDNFAAALERLLPNLINSLTLTIPAAIISSILGSLNGYVLSKWKFRGANLIFTLVLFGMFIPYQSVLIPLVQFMQRLGLYGGIPGLILVHVIYGIPITTLIFRNYYASVPGEVMAAARIDGADFLGIYRYIMIPLSLPGFVVVIIWQFTNIWNEFLFAVVLTNPANWPITVALNNLAGSQIVEWNVQMAGALLAAIPTLIVYVLLGRYFIRGLMAGALKG
ncbi:MAG TPA: carbohydrate ABC transporter permease [Anaerolineales bacterium]|nr:carbohydrate ABC transporter permease [Anaerolineales bacterium]